MTQFSNAAACFNPGYPLPKGSVGRGKFKSCMRDVSRLLSVHRMPVRLPHVGEEKMPFLGIAGFYYTAKGLALPVTFAKPFTLRQFENRGSAWCAQSWATLQARTDDPYLHMRCFVAAYYTALLENGYGLPAQFALSVADTINDTPLSWTLGVLYCHGTACFRGL